MASMGPVAELDAVRRLRVLAGALGATYVEETVPVPYGRIWAVAADLEETLPRVLPDIRSFRVVERDGDRFRARARGQAGMRGWFDGVFSPGMWLMQSRFLIGGMAAADTGEGTRVAFLGLIRFPGFRLARPMLRPILTRYGKLVLRRLAERSGG